MRSAGNVGKDESPTKEEAVHAAEKNADEDESQHIGDEADRQHSVREASDVAYGHGVAQHGAEDGVPLDDESQHRLVGQAHDDRPKRGGEDDRSRQRREEDAGSRQRQDDDLAQHHVAGRREDHAGSEHRGEADAFEPQHRREEHAGAEHREAHDDCEGPHAGQERSGSYAEPQHAVPHVEPPVGP